MVSKTQITSNTHIIKTCDIFSIDTRMVMKRTRKEKDDTSPTLVYTQPPLRLLMVVVKILQSFLAAHSV